MSDKILVTGAGGCIGRVVCRLLRQRGTPVRGLFMPGEPTLDLDESGVEVFVGDLTQPSTLAGLAQGCTGVIHLAALVADWGPYNLFQQVHVAGTRNLLDRVPQDLRRFVHISSISAYGPGRHMGGLTEDAPLIRTGLGYADGKVDAERLARRVCAARGIPLTVVRPSHVMGPASIWSKSVVAAFRRGPVPVVDGGRFRTSFVGVENLADGILLALDSDEAAGRTYQFRDEWPVTWREYLTDVGRILSRRPGPSLPFGVARRLAHLIELVCNPLGVRPPITRLAVWATGRDNDVDTSRARRELGWVSRVSYVSTLRAVEQYILNELDT